jgi:hypothetical protein
MYCIKFAQDMVQWRALVNTVLEVGFRKPKMRRISSRPELVSWERHEKCEATLVGKTLSGSSL